MKNTETGKTSEIQRADPGARMRAFGIIGAVVLVGLAVALGQSMYQEDLNEWLKGQALNLINRPELMFLVLFFVALPLVGISIYVYVQGARIVKSRRIPYPGQKVIKDTPVIEGESATQRGRALQIIAVLMAVFSLALPLIPLIMMAYLKSGN